MIQIRLNNPDLFRQLISGTLLANRRARKKTGDKVFDLLYQAADKHTKTGSLIRSLKQTSAFISAAYTISHDLRIAPHAIFVHWPTRAHIIRPKNRKALRWPVGGAFAFAKIVHHPGYRGDPYFVRIATPERIKGIFDAFLTAELPR